MINVFRLPVIIIIDDQLPKFRENPSYRYQAGKPCFSKYPTPCLTCPSLHLAMYLFINLTVKLIIKFNFL